MEDDRAWPLSVHQPHVFTLLAQPEENTVLTIIQDSQIFYKLENQSRDILRYMYGALSPVIMPHTVVPTHDSFGEFLEKHQADKMDALLVHWIVNRELEDLRPVRKGSFETALNTFVKGYQLSTFFARNLKTNVEQFVEMIKRNTPAAARCRSTSRADVFNAWREIVHEYNEYLFEHAPLVLLNHYIKAHSKTMNKILAGVEDMMRWYAQEEIMEGFSPWPTAHSSASDEWLSSNIGTIIWMLRLFHHPDVPCAPRDGIVVVNCRNLDFLLSLTDVLPLSSARETCESLVGTTITDGGFVSTSLKPQHFFCEPGADKRVALIFHLPEGFPYLFLFSYETELLLPPGTTYRITRAMYQPVTSEGSGACHRYYMNVLECEVLLEESQRNFVTPSNLQRRVGSGLTHREVGEPRVALPPMEQNIQDLILENLDYESDLDHLGDL